ncbi:MAG TPA: hypothetical protein VFE13_04505 [Caulobacteraceae bacterium]|nr:hypothetical protein [Caulobacteraceae bacterium]
MLIALAAVPLLLLLALAALGWAVIQGIAERVEADDPPPYRPYAASRPQEAEPSPAWPEPASPQPARPAPQAQSSAAPSLRRHFFEQAAGLR